MNRLLWLLCIATIVIGCKKDTGGDPPPPPPPSERFAYIVNEGTLGSVTTASLSVYDVDRDVVYRNAYESANNNVHLGGAAKDIKIVKDVAYIIMAGSNEIKKIGVPDNKLIFAASYPGDSLYNIALDTIRNRAYVTLLSRRAVRILNLTNLSSFDTVHVGPQPKGLVIAGNKLFVCNSGNGRDSTISVMNLATTQVESTIIVGKNPIGIVKAMDGKVWVACGGYRTGDSLYRGSVYVLNPVTNAVEDSVLFEEKLFGNIVADTSGYVYVTGYYPPGFFGGPIHRINTLTKEVTFQFIPAVNGVFYTVAFNRYTGELYVGDVKNFQADGRMQIYRANGQLRKTFTAQLGPVAMDFRWPKQ